MANLGPKTGLKQQKEIVEKIQKVGLIEGIKLLRTWLADCGYEGAGECKHYAIVRTTGRCMNCSAYVQSPMPYSSEEATVALRNRLSGVYEGHVDPNLTHKDVEHMILPPSAQ